MHLLGLTFLGLCAFFASITQAQYNPTINTPLGKVVGKSESILDKDLVVFSGIPYAVPPLKELRFRKPVKLTKFSNTIQATAMPPNCMQINPFIQNYTKALEKDKMSEDCLYLNIWVPKWNGTGVFRPKAVMVWIYGGGYTMGGTDVDIYKGNILAVQGDVVVVSFNYRVGALGFLNAGTTKEPGNIGLYDQVAALEWIQDNIIFFGGDPHLVTLFGESAGSFSIGYHITSPISQNLFKNAIMQSGVPNGPLYSYTFDQSLNATKALAHAADCDENDFLQCLKESSSEDLMRAEYIVSQRNIFYAHFLPNTGEGFIKYKRLIPFQPPYVGKHNIMIGISEKEGSTFLYDFFGEDLVNKKDLTKTEILDVLKPFLQDIGRVKYADLMIKSYFKLIGEQDHRELKIAWSNLIGDWLMRCPSLFFSRFYSENHNQVQFYYFNHQTNKTDENEWMGASHFEEVQYVMGYPFMENLEEKYNYTQEEKKFSLDLMDLWSSFAKSNSPSTRRYYSWPPFDVNHKFVLYLEPIRNKIGVLPQMEKCDRLWGPYHYYPTKMYNM